MDRWRERFDLMQRYGFDANRLAGSLVLMSVIAAVSVTLASYLQAPEYEASAKLWADWKSGEYWQTASGSGEQIRTLEYRQPTPLLASAVHSRPIASSAIHRLKLEITPTELLYKLDVEQAANTNFIVLTYRTDDPVEATKIVNTVEKVVVEIASHRRSDAKVVVWREAKVPESPVRSSRPLFSGLLVLFAGLALSSAPIAPARTALAAAAGKLGERVRVVVVQGGAQAQALGGRRAALRQADARREKALLRALSRHGPLTALEAAFVCGLPVSEVDRRLTELAGKGHIEVIVKDGQLHYAHWEPDA